MVLVTDVFLLVSGQKQRSTAKRNKIRSYCSIIIIQHVFFFVCQLVLSSILCYVF